MKHLRSAVPPSGTLHRRLDCDRPSHRGRSCLTLQYSPQLLY